MRFMCAKNRISTFLPPSARLFEGFGIGQCADTITHIFVEVAGEFAHCHKSCTSALVSNGSESFLLAL